MKKQLLIAAVAATMTSVAFADVSITGGSKVNWTSTDTTGVNNSAVFKHDIDLTVVGKTGDTAVSVTMATAQDSSVDNTADTTFDVENAFMTTKVMGANVKVGQWDGANTNMSNGGRSAGKFSADYTVSGVKIQFEDQSLASKSVTVSGSVAGVAVSHEVFQNDNTDSTVSGSFGGVNAKYRAITIDQPTDAKDDSVSYTLSTDVQGVNLSYQAVDVDNAGVVAADDWFGTLASFNEASGYGVSTAMAGNTVTLKSYDISTTQARGDDSYTKLVVTRPLAAGATFEMTYTDADMSGATADKTTLDLELAVKF